MKKMFACILSFIAAMLVSCGESSESSSDSKTESATSSVVSETESAGESSELDVKPVVVSAPDTEIGQSLANYENASLRFSEKMNFSDFAMPLAANNYADDESHIKLSIETVQGIPMLKVETLDKGEDDQYKTAKLKLLMNKLFENQESKLPDIYTIRIDVVCSAIGPAIKDDGAEAMVPGYFGGKVITQPRTEDGSNSWNELYEFSESEWEENWASYEIVVRPGIKSESAFIKTKNEQYLTIMKWSIPNNACFYIADIKFEDENGNVLACSLGN